MDWEMQKCPGGWGKSGARNNNEEFIELCYLFVPGLRGFPCGFCVMRNATRIPNGGGLDAVVL